MYKLNLKLDYKFAKNEEPNDPSLQALMRNYIQYAAGQSYPQGLEGGKRRIFGRIQRKLDDAIDADSAYIALEEAEKDLVKELWNKTNFPSAEAKYVNVAEEEIFALEREDHVIDLGEMFKGSEAGTANPAGKTKPTEPKQ